MTNDTHPEAILIYPKLGIESKDSGCVVGIPHSILTLAASLANDFNVSLFDQRTETNWQKVLGNLITSDCCCVGISSMTGSQLKNALSIARYVRKIAPNIPIVWGGIHVSILPEQSLESNLVDIVVTGEGDITMHELLSALKNNKPLDPIHGIMFKTNGKIIQTPPRPLLAMENLQPLPWEMIHPERYFMKGQLLPETKREMDLGETSRGCPFRCNFCYNSTKTRFTWRAMSPEKTVRLIKDAIDRFDIDAFWLRDDNFFVNIGRVDKILDLMKKENIRIPWYCPGLRIDTVNQFSDAFFKKLLDSNIRRFRIGVESGNDRVLKLINKGITVDDIIKANRRLRDSKIPSEYTFIIGFPGETLDEMIDTADLVLRMKEENPYGISHNINIFTPYPGTQLYASTLECGLVAPTTIEGWADYHHMNMNLNNYDASQEAIMKSICELSYYTAGIVYENMATYLKIVSYPMRKWSEFRFRHKFFRFRPDLECAKFFRDLIIDI